MTRAVGGARGALTLALFGEPVGHSRSPELFDGLRLADGRRVRYELEEVAAGRLPAALATVRDGRRDGANVTVPHKRAAARLVDALDAAAVATGAVNVVARAADGTLRGASTDGAGFLEALAALGPPAPLDAVILGSGGAARAVEDALARRGARATLVSRTPGSAAPVHAGTPVLGWDHPELVERVRGAGLVVQATPLGMPPHEDRLPPLPPEAIAPRQRVVDLVYAPWETPFLALARARGARAVNGWPMLVGQAAAALDLWAGPGSGEAVRRRAAGIERRDPAAA